MFSGDEVSAPQRERILSELIVSELESVLQKRLERLATERARTVYKEELQNRQNVENALNSQLRHAAEIEAQLREDLVEQARRERLLEEENRELIESKSRLRAECEEMAANEVQLKSQIEERLTREKRLYQQVQSITEERDKVRRDLELLKPFVSKAKRRQKELVESEADMRNKYDELMRDVEKQREILKYGTNEGENDHLHHRLQELESQLQQTIDAADNAAANLTIAEEKLRKEIESHLQSEQKLTATKLLADKLERELENAKIQYQLKQEVVKETQIRQLEGMSKKSEEVKELLMKLMEKNNDLPSTADIVSKPGSK